MLQYKSKRKFGWLIMLCTILTLWHISSIYSGLEDRRSNWAPLHIDTMITAMKWMIAFEKWREVHHDYFPYCSGRKYDRLTNWHCRINQVKSSLWSKLLNSICTQSVLLLFLFTSRCNYKNDFSVRVRNEPMKITLNLVADLGSGCRIYHLKIFGGDL